MIAQRPGMLTDLQLLRPQLALIQLGIIPQQHGAIVIQAMVVGMRPAPVLQRFCAADVVGQNLMEKLHAVLLTLDHIMPAALVLFSLKLLQQLSVLLDKFWFFSGRKLQIIGHQCLLNKDLPGVLGIKFSIARATLFIHRQSVQRGALPGQHLTAVGIPPRIIATGPQQMRTKLLQPLRLNHGAVARKNPAGLDHLGGNDPARRFAGQHRTGEDAETAPACTGVSGHRLALLVCRGGIKLIAQTHPAEHAGQQCLMDGVMLFCSILFYNMLFCSILFCRHSLILLRRWRLHLPAQRAHLLQQLAAQIQPFTHAHEVDKVRLAPAPQGTAAKLLLVFMIIQPELIKRHEIRVFDNKARLHLIGFGGLLQWPFARILNAQHGGDGQHLVQAVPFMGGLQHARHAHIHRQACQLATGPGQTLARVNCAQLDQFLQTITDHRWRWRFDEGKIADIFHITSQPHVQHAQDHRGQRGAQYLRLGKLRPRQKIFFTVKPDCGTRPQSSTATTALIGAGLRNRLDRQALNAAAMGIAADARQATVDDKADARHGERGLGDVGGQHHASLRPGPKHLHLRIAGQPRVQRHDFGVPELRLAQILTGFADFALAGQKHQNVAARVNRLQFIDAVGNPTVQAAINSLIGQWPVTDIDRVTATCHVDDRRVVIKRREAFGINRGRGDDDAQIRTFGQHAPEQAEQKIDVQTALMRLVNDDGVIAVKKAVALRFRQQDAVGHELDQRVRGHLLGKAHLKTDLTAQLGVQFLGHARGHAARGNAPRLGATDHAALATPRSQAKFRQLGGFAGAGVAGDNDHLMLLDRRDDIIGVRCYWQLLVHRDGRHTGLARL